jgi:hypothetical protein
MSTPGPDTVARFLVEQVATGRDVCRVPLDLAAAVTGLGGESGGEFAKADNEHGG